MYKNEFIYPSFLIISNSSLCYANESGNSQFARQMHDNKIKKPDNQTIIRLTGGMDGSVKYHYICLYITQLTVSVWLGGTN